jgi:tetratricopeptide (TPR) repeat protein
MAMKYASRTIMELHIKTLIFKALIIKALIAVPALALLVSCASQTEVTVEQKAPIAAFVAKQKEQQQESNSPELEPAAVPVVVELQPTQLYLPNQTYDELGKEIAYIAAPNPYLQQSGVIPTQAVKLFINARRDMKAKRFDKAKKTLLELTEQAPTLSGPRVKLAQIAEHNKDLGSALKHYREAITINPSNVNAYIGLAKVQRILGQYKRAQNTYVNALQAWKDFPEAHANLAVLYDLYLNKPIAAQQHLEAYQFLTEGKNQQVTEWFTELKQRTGINESFIENPPEIKAAVEVAEQVEQQTIVAAGDKEL